MLEIKILGAVAAAVDGRQLRIRGRLERTTLAALAMEDGRIVSNERLIDSLWGDRPPATVRSQVHTRVCNLRRLLSGAGAPEVIRTECSGYWLVTNSETVVDVTEVAAALAEARAERASGRESAAAALTRRALSRWTGPPIVGVTSYFAHKALPYLEELRLALLEQTLEADLEWREPHDLVPELTALVGEYPLSERLRWMLVFALASSDRRGDALAELREARRVLRDELGVDLTQALLDLESSILRGGLQARFRRYDGGSIHRAGLEAE